MLHESVNDDERQHWSRRENREGEMDEQLFASVDELDSTVLTCMADSQIAGSRKTKTQSQEELLTHVGRALALHGGQADTSLGHNVPRRAAALDKRKLAAVVTLITKLNSGGIEILKLGRQNKWQPRVLAASKETMSLSSGPSVSATLAFPRALLWLRSFDSRSGNIAKIKKQGRGGMLLTDIVKVAKGFGTIKVPPFPRRSNAKFSALYGLVLTYKQGNGMERLVALAFRSQSDADNFAAALVVIKELVSSVSS